MPASSTIGETWQDEGAEPDIFQDAISQFPFLNGFAHLLLGFELSTDVSRHEVLQALTGAANEVVSRVPWLAGQVRHTPGEKGFSGTYKPAAWPESDETNTIVVSRDCDDLMPSMPELLRANVPIRQLSGDVLTPYPGLPRPHGIQGPVPVIRLQANFIRQGLLLNVSTHHNILDATGLLQLVRLLAAALNGDAISDEDIEQANRDRSRVIPLIPPGESTMDYSHLRRPGDFELGAFISPPQWCYFHLPLTALSSLRRQAMSEAASEFSGSLSENDVICAFIWQRVSALRLARSSLPGAAESNVKFGRAIDARMTMGVPSSYMGHMIYHASTWMRLSQIASSSLSTLALALRRDLNAVNNEWAVRSFATFIAREPDKSKLMYGGKFDPTVDLIATSTTVGMGDAREGASSLQNFGPLLGNLRFFRRPNTTPLPGSITITPAERGNIPIVLCLPREELDGLNADATWKRYFRMVG